MTTRESTGIGNRITWLIALFALIAGVVAAGLTLRAVLGVWSEQWDFRRGFQLLFAEGTGTSQWTHIVGIACVIDAIVIGVLAKVLGATNARRTSAVALMGALLAFVAWYVPNSYRPAENIPGIHDIATDRFDPPEFVDVLALRADAPNTTEYGRSEGMTPEELRRLTDEAYPDLVPLTLGVPPAEAFARAAAAVRTLGWEVVSESPADGRIEATDTTFWFRFKDDVVIRIRPDAAGSIVDARSVSRVGGGDAGTNARRLREFFAEL